MTPMSPEEYRKIMRRDLIAKWMTPVMIAVAIAVFLYVCPIRKWLGIEECCCCGGTSYVITPPAGTKKVTVHGIDFSGTTYATPLARPVLMGDGSAGRPFVMVPRSPSTTMEAAAGPTTDFPVTSTTPSGISPEPVDITGELGDGGDTYVDTWLPPDDVPACQGVCYQIGGTTPTPPVGPPSAVPETASWLDMICGFAVLGCALRLRSALA